jgi:hypothetical protein
MIKCLENHKHLIFLKQEQMVDKQFFYLNSKVKIRVLQVLNVKKLKNNYMNGLEIARQIS